MTGQLNTTVNILPLTYLGNIRYWTKLCFTDYVIDIHEHYVKQSYRNRCDILTANGIDSLTVNVVKGGSRDKKPVKDIRIDYSQRWQHQHWGALVSAYKNSPFFDYYADRFEPFYNKRFDFLLDLNTEIYYTVFELLGNNNSLNFSNKYIEHGVLGTTDCRDSISRSDNPDSHFSPTPYWQVFSDRMPFQPNLSIIDLLFCAGPESIDILRQSHIAE